MAISRHSHEPSTNTTSSPAASNIWLKHSKSRWISKMFHMMILSHQWPLLLLPDSTWTWSENDLKFNFPILSMNWNLWNKHAQSEESVWSAFKWSNFAHAFLPTQFKTLSIPTDSLNSTYAFVHAFDAWYHAQCSCRGYPCIFLYIFQFHIATFQMRLLQQCLQVTKVLQYEFLFTWCKILG